MQRLINMHYLIYKESPFNAINTSYIILFFNFYFSSPHKLTNELYHKYYHEFYIVKNIYIVMVE